MNRYSTIAAATALLVTTSALAQSTPDTAAPAGPSLAPVTGSSTVGQPGTPSVVPQMRSTAHYHHIIHHAAYRKHHRVVHHAPPTKSDETSSPQ